MELINKQDLMDALIKCDIGRQTTAEISEALRDVPVYEVQLDSIDIDTIRQSISHYGVKAQSVVCMEECSELIQAISKELRGKSDKEHLAEEMADVMICLNMLQQMHNISDEALNVWMRKKLERTRKRMEQELATDTNVGNKLDAYKTKMSIYAEQHKLILATDVLDMLEELQECLDK